MLTPVYTRQFEKDVKRMERRGKNLEKLNTDMGDVVYKLYKTCYTLSFYFKSPQCAPNLYPEHDLFIQLKKLKNTLRYLIGEEQITHLGLDYYYEI